MKAFSRTFNMQLGRGRQQMNRFLPERVSPKNILPAKTPGLSGGDGGVYSVASSGKKSVLQDPGQADLRQGSQRAIFSAAVRLVGTPVFQRGWSRRIKWFLSKILPAQISSRCDEPTHPNRRRTATLPGPCSRRVVQKLGQAQVSRELRKPPPQPANWVRWKFDIPQFHANEGC